MEKSLTWIILIASIALGAFGQIFMKEGMKQAGPVPLDRSVVDLASYFLKAIFSFQLIGAAVCYGVSFLMWLAVLSVLDLSLARPIMATGYLITMIYGYFAGEELSVSRVAGTLLIVAGLFFVAKSGGK